jgi:hypothetical protein
MPETAVPDSATLTPAQLAARWQCSPEQIQTLIRAGKLAAVNIGLGLLKPRYRISALEVQRFELARSTAPTPTTPRRRRSPDGVIEFFK